MPTLELGDITLPPRPSQGRTPGELQEATAVWTKKCEQTIRQIERFLRALQDEVGTGGGTGTVTSVGLSMPVEFSVSGTPVTSSGTLTVSKATQSANTVYAGPTGGAAAQPTFRALVAADIPALSYVTSVALSAPAEFSVSGSPVTSSGTLTFTKADQSANTVWAGPTGGGAAAPTFRALVAADIPALSYVTSVALSVPAEFSVSGSPITSSGTFTVSKANQNANLVYAGPASGAAAAPTFRSLVVADLPGVSDVYFVSIFNGMLPTTRISLTGGVVTAATHEAACEPFDTYDVGTAPTMGDGSGWDGDAVIIEY
jgi:hypothetical protein